MYNKMDSRCSVFGYHAPFSFKAGNLNIAKTFHLRHMDCIVFVFLHMPLLLLFRKDIRHMKAGYLFPGNTLQEKAPMDISHILPEMISEISSSTVL